jgi:hypothetical protein
MNTNQKKLFLILGGGFIIYWLFNKIKPIDGSKTSSGKKTTTSKIVSEADKKNAAVALTAYSDAQKAGESKAFLDEMNLEFAKQYGLKVYSEKSSGQLIATDLSGNKIL